MGGRAQKKQKNLRALLAGEYKAALSDHPLLPIRPELELSHVLPSTAKVFQSAMTPFCLEFVIEGSERCGRECAVRRRGAISVKSLRKDSLSTTSDPEAATEICKGCGNTFPRCTCLMCIECKGVLTVNVGAHGAREA